MTVYVDDMYKYPMGQYGRMKMSHLIADTDEELHTLAAKIGIKREWHQDKASGSHYDIALWKRSLALTAGAVAITLKQCAAMNARRRVEGVLGKPEEAEEWLRNYRSRPAV